jgi:mono/diheme cytochrome c family protein
MKKFFHFTGLLLQVVILAILANVRIASGQTVEKQKITIPEDINKIFQRSCMSCHGSDGGRLPKSKLNFSRWAAYDEAKQIEKASLICNELRKGKMPPKPARESNPELIPTKEQTDSVCKWAEAVRSEKKKNK